MALNALQKHHDQLSRTHIAFLYIRTLFFFSSLIKHWKQHHLFARFVFALQNTKFRQSYVFNILFREENIVYYLRTPSETWTPRRRHVPSLDFRASTRIYNGNIKLSVRLRNARNRFFRKIYIQTQSRGGEIRVLQYQNVLRGE